MCYLEHQIGVFLRVSFKIRTLIVLLAFNQVNEDWKLSVGGNKAVSSKVAEKI